MKLDLLLFGRITSGPFFALLEKKLGLRRLRAQGSRLRQDLLPEEISMLSLSLEP